MSINILDVVRDKLPRGSGFDYDWEVTFNKGKIKAESAFTCYDEHGSRHGALAFVAWFFVTDTGEVEFDRVLCSLSGSTLTRYWYDTYRDLNKDYFAETIAYAIEEG